MHILAETEQRYKKGKLIVQVCFLFIMITYIFSIGFELLSNNTSTAFRQVIVLAFLSVMMYLAYTGVKWSKNHFMHISLYRICFIYRSDFTF